jgi:hypothetical protein
MALRPHFSTEPFSKPSSITDVASRRHARCHGSIDCLKATPFGSKQKLQQFQIARCEWFTVDVSFRNRHLNVPSLSDTPSPLQEPQLRGQTVTLDSPTIGNQKGDSPMSELVDRIRADLAHHGDETPVHHVAGNRATI